MFASAVVRYFPFLFCKATSPKPSRRPWPASRYPIAKGVLAISAAMPPDPCTAVVSSGQLDVDPASRVQLAGQAVFMYSVVPAVLLLPRVRWTTTMFCPAGTTRSGFSATISAWSQVLICREKILASKQASSLTSAPPFSAAGTLWKMPMAPTAKGMWTILNLSRAKLVLDMGMSPLPKSFWGTLPLSIPTNSCMPELLPIAR
mmetsp:Transcript_4772/g.9936  ORF Transcript_4772/g.9936 Transcript_4772/m.9936 type:complete len:203 (+) Transcript_4772:853-1461(+)